jgi:hypothetical protein
LNVLAVTVLALIASLNVATRAVAVLTPVAPLAGETEVTDGVMPPVTVRVTLGGAASKLPLSSTARLMIVAVFPDKGTVPE